MHTLNQRRQPRQPIRSFLCLDFKGSHEAPVLDLSESGVSVVSAVPLISQRRVTCRLGLDRPIEAEALITRTDDTGRAGLQFLSMSESDRLQLKEWLFINALTGGMPPLQETTSSFGNVALARKTPEPPSQLAVVSAKTIEQDSEEWIDVLSPLPGAEEPRLQRMPSQPRDATAAEASEQAQLFPVPSPQPMASASAAPPELIQSFIQPQTLAAMMSSAEVTAQDLRVDLQEATARYLLEDLEARATPLRRQATFALSGIGLMLVAGGLGVWILRSPAPVTPSQQSQQTLQAIASADTPQRVAGLQPEHFKQQTGRIGGGTVVAPSRIAAGGKLPLVTGIRHWSTPQYTRVAIDLQHEVGYLGRRLSSPDRIFFDLHDAQLARELVGKEFEVKDGRLLKIRVAQYQPRQARIVLDLSDISDYSAVLQSNPSRLIIEIRGRKIHDSAIRSKPHGKHRAQTGKADQAPSVVARTSVAR